jgi:hypothetical protein
MHCFNNFESHCWVLREKELIVDPIDDDAIMLKKEAVIAWTDIETKLIGEGVAETFIEELGRSLELVERLGKMETLSCLLIESWWQ